MMNALSVEVTYRKGKPFAAYVYLGRKAGQKSVRTVAVAPELLIDYADDGTPIGTEVVSPGYVTIEEILAVFDKLGLNRPDPEELAPVQAA